MTDSTQTTSEIIDRTPEPQPGEIILSQEQQFACDHFGKWYKRFPNVGRKYFVIEGYAGTGKSFIVNRLIEEHDLRACYMAYTGKAALVLRRYSGVDARTIHSTIYKLRMVSDETLKKLYAQLEETADLGQRKELENKIEELKQPKFELNPDAFSVDGEDAPDILVLDECSMVDEEMLADLCSFGIPIIALGDPGQLPPVKGEGALFKGLPDARLTEIRRQALDSPIIKWSMFARKKMTLPMGELNFDAEVTRVPKSMVSSKEFFEQWSHHDITVCWRNKTRQEINQFVRKQLGHHQASQTFPVVGETLIITKNDKSHGIFNGMFCEVLEVGELFDNYIEVKVLDELGVEHNLKLLRACFEEYYNPGITKALKPWDFRDTQQADFGYCITCHKAQGSQWERVLVMDEDVFNWYKGDAQDRRAEWIYTAITRAVKKVTIISGR